MILTAYRALSALATPFLRVMLTRRIARGKELPERVNEKWGIASLARPQVKLVWFHAASVGELRSILPLIEWLLSHNLTLHILVTTVTVTSARLAASILPERALHQFLPLDTPHAVDRFLSHWQPDAGWLTESELWPNLIHTMKQRVRVCGIINGRMSETSYRGWRRVPQTMRSLLHGLHVFAQSEADAARYQALGASSVHTLGNLKHDAPALPVDETELHRIRQQIGSRPVWLAASLHHQEYPLIEEVLYPELQKQFPDLLTIIVPRHPEKAERLSAVFSKSARRSRGEPITKEVDVYIADTMGELGLWYRTCQVVLMGGSFFAHGGQNLVEPARIGCAMICSASMYNFAEAYQDLQSMGACIESDWERVTEDLAALLRDPARVAQMQQAGRACVARYAGIIARTGEALQQAMKSVL